jgi:Predicted dehydrogenases and related proteins
MEIHMNAVCHGKSNPALIFLTESGFMFMRFGIIGLGNHAINRVMPAIVTSGNQIAAVYSRNLEKARKESIPYGSEPFDDLDAFFEKGDFESVYIASPNFLHYSQAMKSLESGKNVLLEKQMTLRNEDAADLVSTAERRGLALAVGFHMRFHPAVAEVRKMVRSQELGKIAYIRGVWAGLSQPSSGNPDRQWWSEEDKVGGGSVMGTWGACY